MNHRKAAALFMGIIVSGLIALVSGCAGAPAPVASSAAVGSSAVGHEALSSFILMEMRTKKIPGLSISVSDSSGILWSRGFGLARKSPKIPFTNTTISNIGSVSKTFTATAIMKLVEAGKVRLDEPLSTYLPEFKPATRGTTAGDITIRRLLTHHSGLSSDNFYRFFLGDSRPENYPRQLSEALDAANALTPVRGPGQVFSYSNLGFSLLGLVVERVSGVAFDDYLRQEIFGPLGMKDSSFIIQDDKMDRYARGFTGAKEVFIPYIRDISAGSLSTTSDDMGLFLSSLLSSWKGGKGIISQETIKEMFSVQNPGVPLDLDFSVGLTWWIVDFKLMPGEFAVGHGGDLDPYHALTFILPERDLAVHIMVNGDYGIGSFTYSEILAEAFKEFSAEKGQKPIAEASPIGPSSPPAALPPSLADEVVGVYATQLGLIQVKRFGTGLKARVFGQWLELSYHADGSFTFGVKILGIPVEVGIFKDLYISTEILDGERMFNLRVRGILFGPDVKIQPSDPGDAWLSRSGSYVQVNAEPKPQFQAVKLGVDKATGFFCLSLNRGGMWSDYPLRTLSDTEAVLEGHGRNLGATLKVVESPEGRLLFFDGLLLKRR